MRNQLQNEISAINAGDEKGFKACQGKRATPTASLGAQCGCLKKAAKTVKQLTAQLIS